MIKKYSTIALTGCSDSLKRKSKDDVIKLVSELNSMGIKAKLYNSIFATESDSTQHPADRARDLMSAFADPDVDAVFDITGGDAANAVLPYLDLALIKSNIKPFYAYSDNSVLLNPLHQRSGVPIYYYQISSIIYNKVSLMRFDNLIHNGNELYDFNYSMLQGSSLCGKEIAGGNVRCTLKLFGTPYQPDFRDRVLFLESYGGSIERMETSFYQYKMAGAFDRCSSILLGNFSEIAQQSQLDTLYNTLITVVDNKDLPIACTREIGHQSDSKCLDYQISF